MNFILGLARRALIAMAVVSTVPAVSGAVLVATSTEAAAAVVSSVSVRGNQRVDDDTIIAYITIKPGVSYSAYDVDESIKVLFGTGLFSDVDIGRSGSVLIVTVAENPVINSIKFVGNTQIKSEILSQVIVSEARGMLTDAQIQTDLSRIREYYARNGRSDVVVDISITDLTNNRVDVSYMVDEGDRTSVKSITFVGNSAFSSTRLRRVISTRTTNILSWINKRDTYTEDKLAQDRDLLRKHYLRFGYADFQILDSTATLDPETGKYHIVFTVDEGPKYRFGNVVVDSSIPGVDSEALLDVVRTHSGDVFNAEKVTSSVEALTIELSRLGFVFAQVQPRGDRNYVDNLIDLTYVVDEGPRAYVERIDIHGNTRTRDYVIRRVFTLSEGDPYNRVLVDRAERRLRELDYFDAVQITTRPGSAPDKVVLDVAVSDKSTGSISASVGLSTDAGLIGEIALEERNFLGRGQNLRISVGGGLDDQTYNVSFTDPYFLGHEMSFGVDAYKATSSRSSVRPYGIDRTGGGIRIGLPITDDTSAQFRYSLSQEKSHGAFGSAATLFPNDTRLLSTAGYSITYSTLDSNLDPSRGARVKFDQDFTGLGGDAHFVKTEIDARYYHPIMPDSDVIGMIRVGAGNVTGLGEDVAPMDNFFIGGDKIRGFQTRGIGPRDLDSGYAVGGKNYVVGTAEVQFPLPGIPEEFGLRGAAFADAGTLFDYDGTFGAPIDIVDSMSIRSSVGGSLLWASPFGLIRLDVAYPLTKEEYDDTQLIRVGAGARF